MAPSLARQIIGRRLMERFRVISSRISGLYAVFEVIVCEPIVIECGTIIVIVLVN